MTEPRDPRPSSPPDTCEDVGHSWHCYGVAADGTSFFRCRRCGRESDTSLEDREESESD